MKTFPKKFLRNAWIHVTGRGLPARLSTERIVFRTYIIKRVLNHTFSLQQSSHLLIPELAIPRYLDKRLRVHTTPIEKF
jgi:hypothetical protein